MVVEPLTSEPDRFSSLKQVLVGRTEDSTEKRSVGKVHPGGKGIRISLTGVDSRNAAEELVGSFLFVNEGERIPLSEGTYFVGELIGMEVVTEEGNLIGTMKEVMKLPAQDVYVVEKDGKQVMIPAVREFVLRIDVQERRMVVKLIEGLNQG
jgi:16S rRNA processing protein RimM